MVRSKPNYQTLSVVIATLGQTNLNAIIELINSGTVIPDEIIICIPEAESHRLANLQYKNVRFCITKERGQVAQRLAGFREAKSFFVLQLDDDVMLESKCIEQLINTSNKLKFKVAVGPTFMSLFTNSAIHARKDRGFNCFRIYLWILNGRGDVLPGTITRAGLNIGWNPDKCGTKLLKVDWVAGGCVLHRKENLVLENFYPFDGKAYCEDLIHSHILHSRNVELYVDGSAKCFIEPNDFNSLGFGDFMTEIRADYRARKFLVKIRSLDLFRLHIYYLLRIFIYLLSSVCYKKIKFFNWKISN